MFVLVFTIIFLFSSILNVYLISWKHKYFYWRSIMICTVQQQLLSCLVHSSECDYSGDCSSLTWLPAQLTKLPPTFLSDWCLRSSSYPDPKSHAGCSVKRCAESTLASFSCRSPVILSTNSATSTSNNCVLWDNIPVIHTMFFILFFTFLCVWFSECDTVNMLFICIEKMFGV